MSTSYRRGELVQHRDTGARGIVNVGTDTIGLTVVSWMTGGTDTLPAVDLLAAQRRHYSPAIDAMIDGWDGGDVWGSAMSMAWAVAEVARAAAIERDADDVELDVVDTVLEVAWGPTVPLSLDELASVEEDPDNRGDVSFETGVLAAAYQDGRVTDEDLVFAARVLARYLDICRAAGLDY